MSAHEVDYEYQVIMQSWTECQHTFHDSSLQWAGVDKESFEREYLSEIVDALDTLFRHIDEMNQRINEVEECLHGQ